MENTTTKLNEFCISKYKPSLSHDPLALVDEWTSISDVGKVYNGVRFTIEEYNKVEYAYLRFVQQLCEATNTKSMQVEGLEDYYNKAIYKNHANIVGIQNIIDVVQSCLREEYWCKLYTDALFLHFGYDYYLYVGTLLDYDAVKFLLRKTGLNVVIKESPYKEKESD